MARSSATCSCLCRIREFEGAQDADAHLQRFAQRGRLGAARIVSVPSASLVPSITSSQLKGTAPDCDPESVRRFPGADLRGGGGWGHSWMLFHSLGAEQSVATSTKERKARRNPSMAFHPLYFVELRHYAFGKALKAIECKTVDQGGPRQGS